MPPEEDCRERVRGAPWGRLAIAAWAVVLVVVCGRVLLSPRANGVYPIFVNAGQSWREGMGLYPGVPRPGVKDEFRYSPAVAALFAPFSLLPDRLGGCLWRLLNAAVYLGAFAWCCRVLGPGERAWTRAELAALWLLLLPLSVGSVSNGQSNPLVAGLLLAAVAGVARGRWNLAAACVAAAALFKGYPIAVGLLLAAVYPRRFGLRLGVALGVGLGLPFLVQQPAYVTGAYTEWLHRLGQDDRTVRAASSAYRDVCQLLEAVGVSLGRAAHLGLQLGTAAGAALLCLAGRAAGWPRLLAALLALGICWMVLCGPATESCTYILLAPVLAWAVVEGWAAPPRSAARWLPAASFGLLLATTVSCWFPVGRPLRELGVQPLAALLLTAALVRVYVAGLTRGRSTQPLAA